MRIDITPLRQIGAIYRASNSFTDYVAKYYNLEKSQYQFLVRIGENPAITQQELSVILQVDKGTVLKAVKKLIVKKYVIRKKHKNDKRKFNLYLTDTGNEVFTFIMKEELFVVDLCLRDLSIVEQKLLCDLLGRVDENIKNLWVDVRKDKLNKYLKKINEITYKKGEKC